MIDNIIKNSKLSIASELISLKSVVENKMFFTIPIYQRLYVWEANQINTLLEDIYKAYEDNESQYFLGGIMLTKNGDNYDLIDGQQRFTTLWLLAYELKRNLLPFIEETGNKEKKKKRIFFSIREFANNFLNEPDNIEHLSDDDKSQLKNMFIAKDTIKDFLKNKTEDHKRLFSTYIFENLALIKTVMPNNIDKNRLFEVLNNRGEQLKHQDILKSKLIEQLNEPERAKYAQLWDACSIMDDYIEKNIKEISGLKWGDLTFKETIEDTEVGLPKNILEKLTQNKLQNKVHFTEILDETYSKTVNKVDNFEYDSGKVRSIISFPMFLLHSLRIFIFQREGKNSENNSEVNEKKLLAIFKEVFYKKYLTREATKDFIELIWKLRIKFDKYVIKWVEIDSNEEHHLIKKLYLNKKALQRKKPTSNEGFSLLQSMLYHSQQITTHYWLTPFMHKMLSTESVDELYSYLKKLDNIMFSSGLKLNLKERSWELINNNFENYNLKISVLDEAKGTSYWSYWFYKLDFILWHERDNLNEQVFESINGYDFNKWKDFRMTKKSSVEHISPQNPKEYDENKIWKETDSEDVKRIKLDDFGNLVLITSSLNSSYGHKTFKEKRTTFIEKKRLDSLKSALIFNNDNWNWSLCEQHRKDMIKLIEFYFKKTQQK